MHWTKELILMAKYGLVGLINTAVTALVMALLSLTGMDYPVYSALGYAVGIANSFFLNFRFTFRGSGGSPALAMGRFVAVGLFCLLAAEAVQHLCIASLGLPEWIGVGTGMVVYTGVGFVLNRLWVFGGPRPVPGTSSDLP